MDDADRAAPEIERIFKGMDAAGQPGGYWCVVCGRYLPYDAGVVVHDDVPHPESLTFDEDERPQ